MYALSSKHCQASDSSYAGGISDRLMDFFPRLRLDWFRRCHTGCLAHRGFLHDIGGLIGALAAAVPGLIDFLYYQGGLPPVKKIATIHLAINLTAVVLYAVNIWLRSRGEENMTLPIAPSIIGVGMIVVSGWLDGRNRSPRRNITEVKSDIARV